MCGVEDGRVTTSTALDRPVGRGVRLGPRTPPNPVERDRLIQEHDFLGVSSVVCTYGHLIVAHSAQNNRRALGTK